MRSEREGRSRSGRRDHGGSSGRPSGASVTGPRTRGRTWAGHRPYCGREGTTGPAASRRGGMVTLEATLPLGAPPAWAVLERRLLDVLDRAVDPFLERYTRPDGRLIW